MGDIVCTNEGAGFVVVGWFTPNYRRLASRLAGFLSEVEAPYHFYAKAGGKDWNTRAKPSVVLDAMRDYPGKVVILMDVDCHVHGPLEPLGEIEGDVGITAIARNVPHRDRFRHWLAVEASSRVVVFNPTEAARDFAQNWRAEIELSKFDHDEHSMMWAILKAMPWCRFGFIPQEYSGREVGQLRGAVVEHESEHNKSKRQDGWRGWLKRIERRWFRTGKTARGKLHGQLLGA